MDLRGDEDHHLQGRHLSHPQEEQPPVQGGDTSWLGLGGNVGEGN